jgi:nitroreductase
MDIPYQRWYPVIAGRHSRRRYDSTRPIPPEVLADLQKACDNFRPFPGARAQLITETPDKIFNLVLGAYGFIRGAPMALAFIGNVNDPHAQEAVGYTGEGLVLEATSLGLSTCWVAGFFRPAVVAEFIKLSPGEKVPAVSPLGYSTRSRTFGERMASGFVRSRRRNPLSALTTGLPESAWPGWVKTVLEAARLSPSAANRQPWRFQIEANAITISTAGRGLGSGVSKRLDCGIAMLHLEVAALHHGIRGVWELLEAPQVARFIFEKSLSDGATVPGSGSI